MSTSDNASIDCQNLVKTFGSFRALDGLNLQVAPGEVHGFLGPNGSGKSTTIRILLGLLRASGGQARLLGADPWADAVNVHRRLAYVPGDVNLWPALSGGECIDLFGSLRGGLDPKRRAHLLKLFELDPTKKTRTYSKGNRQKVALVAALASDVDLYILDEPTSGLDPLMEANFRDAILELKSRGKTVLLSSHILSEVEALCDRITIIKDGRTVESGTLAELRHLHRMSIEADTAKPATGLKGLPGVHDVAQQGTHLAMQVENAAMQAVLAHLVQFGIKHLVSTPPSLEDLFMRHYAAAEPAAQEGRSAERLR